MTLNGVMAVTSRYFTEIGKPVYQHITASICSRIYARVSCRPILLCVCAMSSWRKFTCAISSPDEFLVSQNVKKGNVHWKADWNQRNRPRIWNNYQ